MNTSLRQSLTQRLQQTLSPLQLKFVRLLEMTQPEVEEEVRHELEENPALAISETDHSSTDHDDYTETSEQLQRSDYGDYDEVPHTRPGARHHRDFDYAEATTDASVASLLDYLTAQINQLALSPAVAAAAEYIAGNLDSNGYLSRPLQSMADDVAFTTGEDIPMATWRQALEAVQSLDPAGVGARDLRDCLLLQLRRMNPDKDTPAAIALDIVDHYFDLFSLKHYGRIESALSITTPQLREAVDVIRSLNPKPAGDIGDDPALDRTRHIVPDFIVDTSLDNDHITVTLPRSVPELNIEKTFATDPADPSARSFVAKRREDATDFIDLIRLRNETLHNVMSAIVSLQRDFFLTGDESDLKPMVLKDISAITGYDLSLISRATAGKYVETPTGIYPLKFFFNEGVASTGNDDNRSTHAILAAIRDIISHENPASPFSDDAITAQLVERGFDVARRTVAKYRERAGFPPARLRKDIL